MIVWFRRSAVATAWAYPVALLAAVFAFKWIGEDWWFTAATLYLPRAGFALPLLVLVPALLAFRAYRALWSQALALVLVLIPLMGLNVPWPKSGATRPPLRVLSLNVSSGTFGYANVAAAIVEQGADLVLLQEAFGDRELLETELRRRYPQVRSSTQFVIASRFPILEVSEPPKLRYEGRDRSPRFIRYVVQSPLGKVTVFSVHPESPRGGINQIRGPQGFRRELLSGHVLSGDAALEVERLTGLRRIQVEAAVRDAADEWSPVIIAGDTNLPTLSKIASDQFSYYQDGFTQAGLGLGYTYPARMKWMRIDRIFASPTLRFTRFEVSCSGVSDHLCVVADLTDR